MFDSAITALIGATGGLASASIVVAGFYYARRSYRDGQVERLIGLEKSVEVALQEGAEAMAACKECKDAAIVQQNVFHLYQLHQAEALSHFITDKELGLIEQRLMEAIRDSSKASVDAVNNLSRRIDGLADKQK